MCDAQQWKRNSILWHLALGKTAKSLPVQRQQQIDRINEWIDFELNRFGILSSLLVTCAKMCHFFRLSKLRNNDEREKNFQL